MLSAIGEVYLASSELVRGLFSEHVITGAAWHVISLLTHRLTGPPHEHRATRPCVPTQVRACFLDLAISAVSSPAVSSSSFPAELSSLAYKDLTTVRSGYLDLACCY